MNITKRSDGAITISNGEATAVLPTAIVAEVQAWLALPQLASSPWPHGVVLASPSDDGLFLEWETGEGGRFNFAQLTHKEITQLIEVR